MGEDTPPTVHCGATRVLLEWQVLSIISYTQKGGHCNSPNSAYDARVTQIKEGLLIADSLPDTKNKPVHLTQREIEILGLIAKGYQSVEAAEVLFVSKRTVDFHLSNIYTKLEARNRMKALRKAESLGLLPFEPSKVSLF